MTKKFILNAILINICILSYIILLIGLISIKNLSLIAIIIISIIYLIALIFILYCYLSKKNIIYNIGIIFTIILTLICLSNINNLNKTYSYIENIFNNKYEYQTYEIYVNKKTTKYSNITKLNGKKIGMLTSNKYNVKKYLNNISDIEYVTYETSDELIIALNNYEVQSIIISEEDYQNIDNQNNLKNKITPIYEGKIKKLNNF